VISAGPRLISGGNQSRERKSVARAENRSSPASRRAEISWWRWTMRLSSHPRVGGRPRRQRRHSRRARAVRSVLGDFSVDGVASMVGGPVLPTLHRHHARAAGQPTLRWRRRSALFALRSVAARARPTISERAGCGHRARVELPAWTVVTVPTAQKRARDRAVAEGGNCEDGPRSARVTRRPWTGIFVSTHGFLF